MAQQKPQKTIAIFGGNPVSTAGTITSAVIDLTDPDISSYDGYFTLIYKTLGTFGYGGTSYAGTAGSAVFTYQVSNNINGPFFSPSGAQPIGTSGSAGTSMDMAPLLWGTSGVFINLPPFPYMVIRAICGTGGTAGVYADLYIR